MLASLREAGVPRATERVPLLPQLLVLGEKPLLLLLPEEPLTH